MLEEEIKKIIINKYGSLRNFSKNIDLPNTTLDSILKRGFINSNIENVMKVFKCLNISLDKTFEQNKIIYNYEVNDSKINNYSKLTQEDKNMIDDLINYKLNNYHKEE